MKVKIKSKKTFVLIIVMAIILGVLFGAVLINRDKAAVDKNVLEVQKQKLEAQKLETTENNIDRLNEKLENLENKAEDSNISVVPTMDDEITGDAAYCPTFQLVWNDMLDYMLNGKPVEFLNGTLEIADNLNKKTFTSKDISEEYYYTKHGPMVVAVRDEIKNAIKEKFDEEKSIVDTFDWDEGEDSNRHIFYAMLKRVFNFEYPFDVLNEGKFEEYNNAKYFGTKDTSDSILKTQVDVLFYDDSDNLAIKLSTKTNDEVILVKTKEEVKTFNDVYSLVSTKSKSYSDNELKTMEQIRIPNLSFDIKKEYDEFVGKKFLDKEGKDVEIEKAIQTIEFELDNEGGKVLSEAAIITKTNAIVFDEERYFNFTSDFYVFVKEADKTKPYLAVAVDDLASFQEDLTKAN